MLALKYKLCLASLLLLGSISFAWANTSNCSPDKKPLWAVGEFITQSIPSSLLLESCDQGQSWHRILEGMPHTEFTDINCNQNGCLILGNQTNAQSSSFWPVLGMKSAVDLNWQIQKMTPGGKDSIFNLINCNNVHCVAMGIYHRWFPRIAVSNDFGNNWYYIDTIDDKPMFPGMKAYVDGLSCQDHSCMAVGEDKKSFILVTRDDGEDWSIKTMKNAPQRVNYNELLCTSERCIIVGTQRLNDTGQGDNSKVFIAYSDDWGESWHYPNLELPNTIHIASFSDISCQQQHCITTGHYYHDDYSFDMPLIATSQDLGQTWSFVEMFLDTSQMKHYPFSHLSDVSCYQEICIAVGDYGGYQKEKPFVALSKDAGKHWIIPKAVFSKLPKKWDESDLRGVKCSEKYCLAWGNIGSSKLFTLYYDVQKDSWSYKNIMPEIGVSEQNGSAYLNAIS